MPELLSQLGVLPIALVALLGLVAGIIGGMLGVGGSVLMIPGLTIILGRNQHLYQAAAMIANVAVALPAARRHKRAGLVVGRVLAGMLPAAVLFAILGVWLSNARMFHGEQGGIWLGRILAAFMVFDATMVLLKMRSGAHDTEALPQAPTPLWKSAAVGAVMGGAGGLLGIGGGALAVPLQQSVLKLPLRNAIANSAFVMVASSTVGAFSKNLTLSAHGINFETSLLLAAMLAPTCMIGGRLGASLTHRLPLKWVRLAYIVLMYGSSMKMAKLW